MFLWMENAVKLVNSCLLIIKALKIQDGYKFIANKTSEELMYHSY